MISVIIPTLNEERALPETLRELCQQSGEFEVILVDGGSCDNTVAIARAWPDLKVLTSSAGRATQMNRGAAAACGNLLLFLHADTVLPDGAIESLVRLELKDPQQWGGFHQSFTADTAGLRAVSRLHNWRCGLTGIFYGDQAMFVASEMFARLGGFPSVPILEDVMLSEQLLKLAKPIFLPGTVKTDSRKFEQMGSLRSFLRCLLILLSYELRLPILGQRFFSAIR